MSKSLWFSVAILLCSALAVEALICNKCRRFKLEFGCIDKKPSSPCTPKPGQKCKIMKSFLGTIRGLIRQGCTKSINECDLYVLNPTLGPVETTCCDDRDHCNTS